MIVYSGPEASVPNVDAVPSLHILTDDALRFGKRIMGTKGPWRCFHCDHLTETEEDAEAHFGRFQECTPACQIAVMAYRKLEDEVSSYRTENDAASKAFYSLGAAHRTALIAAEQAGYDKGLADGLAEGKGNIPPHAVGMKAEGRNEPYPTKEGEATG